MPSLKTVATFVAAYYVSECIEKDSTLKPLFCTLVSGVSTYYSWKLTVQNAEVLYDTVVKPGLKYLAIAKIRGPQNLPDNGVPPVRNIGRPIGPFPIYRGPRPPFF